jgi:hypothetical protein
MKSTNDVLNYHLEAIEQGDVNAVLSDYEHWALVCRAQPLIGLIIGLSKRG